MNHDSKQSFPPPRHLGFVLAALLLLFSCRTQQVAQTERKSSDSTATALRQYDSIHIDRFVIQQTRHDTVFLTDTRTEYRYRNIRDTVIRVRHDTVTQTVREQYNGERVLKPPLSSYLFIAAVLAVLAGMVYSACRR